MPRILSHVVCWVEHLRDGHEVGAKPVASVAEGLEVINKLADYNNNIEFQLFSLGHEIKLTKTVVEVQQKPVLRTKFEVATPLPTG